MQIVILRLNIKKILGKHLFYEDLRTLKYLESPTKKIKTIKNAISSRTATLLCHVMVEILS